MKIDGIDIDGIYCDSTSDIKYNVKENNNNEATISNYLKELGTKRNISDDEIKKISIGLAAIYETDYRHSYHFISAVIYEIDDDYDILNTNIEKLKDIAYEKYYENKIIFNKFLKLYDHVLLETVRVSEYNRKYEDVIAYTNNVQGTVNTTVSEKMGDFENLSKDLEKKISGYQTESISILGIFAAIVLAFTGGIVYSSSVLNNIHKSSPFRLVTITLIIGFVIINTITILLMYIDKIRQYDNNELKYPKSVKHVNLFLIFGILVTFLLWVWFCHPYNT